jgi:uncharacterized protein DUF4129
MPEDQALDRLHTILARPEYRVDQGTPWWQQLLAPILDYLWSLLGQLVQLVLNSASGREGAVGLGVLLACAVVLAAALVYLGRALRLSIGRESGLRAAGLAERRERSDQLWQAAQERAAAADFGGAVRLTYLSALYALDEHALVHLERSLTNREHARRLQAAHPAFGPNFNDLVERYERVRYGRAIVGAEAFKDFSDRAERVRSAALQGAAA